MKKVFYDKRNFKYGSFSVAITVLVILAVLAINILASYVEETNGIKADFTPAKSYTLDANAAAAIKDLDKEVIIYTFIPGSSSSDYSAMTENIVSLFDGASDKITSKNVDPIVNPSELRRFSTDTKELASYSVVVADKNDETNFHAYNEEEMVEYNSKTYKSYFVLQRWITSALMYMRTGVRQNVYILTGHGETIDDDTATMINRIKRENYEVKEISLLSGQQKLVQGDILVVLEPTSDLSKDEYNQIISFLTDSYGRMLFIASRLADDAGEPLKNYTNLLDYFNIIIEDGVVAETNDNLKSTISEKSISLTANNSHEISSAVRAAAQPLWVSEASAYKSKYSDSITTGGRYEETFTAVLTSSQTSVLVPWSSAASIEAADYEKGVHNIVCAYERNDTGVSGTVANSSTRILLVGSETIATGDYLGNSNILRNGVNWLAGRSASETLVNLGIDLTSSYVQMSQLQTKIWFIVLVIAIPAVLLAVGIIVWVRRKNL